MKILMVAPEPFFEPRGTPISIYQRLEALSALGYQVDLVTYPLGKDIYFPNVRIFRTRNIGFITNVRVGPSRAKILLDFFLFLKVFWMLLRNNYDVVHSHEEAAFFCAPLAMIFRKRHLYDMHSVLSKQLGNFNFGNRPIFIKLFEFLENMVLRTCDAVITVGSDIQEHVRKINPKVREIKIENIALHAFQMPVKTEAIVELKKRLNLNSCPTVVYTGTFELYQGLEMVLECSSIVRIQFPSVIFIFVGAKRDQAETWMDKARKFKVDNFTLFLDAVSPEESMVYLASATVLISPRLLDTSVPLKIYSYLHSGKPIVATNIHAHTQVLNPNIAYLVEPNKDAFAEGIMTLLRNPEFAESLGENAHNFAKENNNYTDYEAKVDQIYRSFEVNLTPEADCQRV